VTERLGRTENWDGTTMKWLFAPLLMLIANSTESELARQVEFLKAENQTVARWVDATCTAFSARTLRGNEHPSVRHLPPYVE
jgi:hypothetical protein